MCTVKAYRGIVPPVIALLALQGCQALTVHTPADDDTAISMLSGGDRAPHARVDDDKVHKSSRANGSAEASKDATYLEQGSGRFVGDQPSRTRAVTAAPGDDGVTLNLVNVPAPQAAKIVLGDMLGIKYTVDPAIEGKITIQTPVPVSRSDAMDLFQAALRANSAALVKANGQYRIVPSDQTAVGAPIRVPGQNGSDEPGSQVRVVQLNYVAPAEIRRVLEPIAPHNSILRADDARHTITLSGNEEEIATMLDAISVFDVDVMRGMSFAIVPVKTSEPTAIADELKNVFGADKEGPMSGMVKFVPNKQLGAILIISPQPRYLTRAETWVRKFDEHAAGTEKQLFTYVVQNRPAQELVEVLQSMFATELGAGRGGGGRNVAPRFQEARVQSSSGFPSGGSTGGQFGSSGNGFGGSSSGIGFGGGNSVGGSGSTGGFNQNSSGLAGSGTMTPASRSTSQSASTTQSDMAGPAESGGTAAEPRIKIVADDSKNAILLEATAADYRRVMKVIETLDVVPNQVLIEAAIAEVTLNDDLQFGVRWSLLGKRTSTSFTDDAGGALSSVFPGFSYAFKTANIAATLNALNSISTVNVISAPSLTVADNKTAVIEVGDQVPIQTMSGESALTSGAPVLSSITYKDTGVILTITPRINQSGRVLLDVEQEVSSVVPTTSSTLNSPTIQERKVHTTVMVNNGEGLALGGMIQTNKTTTSNQLPVVGDVPFLGDAFKQKDNRIQKTELIIIITPHVMRNLEEARTVTDEFRRQLAQSLKGSRPVQETLMKNIQRTFQ